MPNNTSENFSNQNSFDLLKTTSASESREGQIDTNLPELSVSSRLRCRPATEARDQIIARLLGT